MRRERWDQSRAAGAYGAELLSKQFAVNTRAATCMRWWVFAAKHYDTEDAGCNAAVLEVEAADHSLCRCWLQLLLLAAVIRHCSSDCDCDCDCGGTISSDSQAASCCTSMWA